MHAALHVDVGTHTPPTRFRLFSQGVNHSDKGDFLFDDKAAAMVMAAYLEKGVDCSIDYDHQALATPAVPAPAAGWFNLAVQAGELWATNVRWTERAAAQIRAGEYRYFSPLFGFDDATGRITSLINCALTNTPALHGIDALVAASATYPTQSTGGSAMTDRELYIAHLAGRTPTTGRMSLSTATGAALDRRTDAQVLAALSADERQIIAKIVGTDPGRIATQARKATQVALARAEGAARAERLEHGRMALGQR